MTGQDTERRYALYYAPAPTHPLSRAAAAWLGRDPFDPDRPPRTDRSAAEVQLTAEPRRYGFHATLKAPFRLAPGTSREELEAAIQRFVQSRPPCPVGPLQVTRLGRFFALTPCKPAPFLQGFAGQLVSEFDRFRAPMTPDDLQRRLEASLDEEQMTNLVRWGYPYVFDRFRFHMTLTGPVPAEDHEKVERRLKDRFEPLLDEDFHVDGITLFEQARAGANFVATSRLSFRQMQLEGTGNER
ncbi:MAG: DUF1045 domain-containing protein [Mesorhizobium sp.]|uniref:DUF1045 domain-containing protein n=1 Tax=Mesorhizobium sp. TaxID=1871066 RepID=UPI000FE9B0A9|nr:DUF1045 domain-containing protein [Mesorhizobium sp.]RWI63658.1 MAG: DUF1045 domain-containing protein [Mesorhizobium sp.]RWJ42697.1 MAG: DUF1045 domain-containing protein [Mesorhizobium sp.]RWJ58102.1 MAG: DUF1045 domain-containing protein [Mesorhizobium sp.]RWJ63994.1 MAG: DUF1045 domain-containing protein [Mesorhizobium sp.]RWJ93870.1 MAG: DUF1045 domain-containing protein [Mesorhizobium sp.]